MLSLMCVIVPIQNGSPSAPKNGKPSMGNTASFLLLLLQKSGHEASKTCFALSDGCKLGSSPKGSKPLTKDSDVKSDSAWPEERMTDDPSSDPRIPTAVFAAPVACPEQNWQWG